VCLAHRLSWPQHSTHRPSHPNRLHLPLFRCRVVTVVVVALMLAPVSFAVEVVELTVSISAFVWPVVVPLVYLAVRILGVGVPVPTFVSLLLLLRDCWCVQRLAPSAAPCTILAI
jgi:hypothetical protein